jgi:hypothetical protein
MDKPTVRCQICRVPMRRQPVAPPGGPGEWRPEGDRLQAVLAEMFQCERCGSLTIRPGAVTPSSSRAA